MRKKISLLITIAICFFVAAYPIIFDFLNAKTGEKPGLYDISKEYTTNIIMLFIIPFIYNLYITVNEKIQGIDSIEKTNSDNIDKVDEYLKKIDSRVNKRIQQINSIKNNYDDLHRRLESLVIPYYTSVEYENVVISHLKEIQENKFVDRRTIEAIASYAFRNPNISIEKDYDIDESRQKILLELSKIIVETSSSYRLLISYRHDDSHIIPFIIREIEFRLKAIREISTTEERIFLHIAFSNTTSHDILLLNGKVFSHFNRDTGDEGKSGFLLMNETAFKIHRDRFSLLFSDKQESFHKIREALKKNISPEFHGMYHFKE